LTGRARKSPAASRLPFYLGHLQTLVQLLTLYRAYNFGLPSLPWVNGRDLAGVVVETSDQTEGSRLRKGDLVLVPSTDYRDIRKAAFQEYAIATHYNAAKIPSPTHTHAAASVGVAFVASVLALGVSLGVDFGGIQRCPGPNLPYVLSKVEEESIPLDIRDECFASRNTIERPRRGDWIAIWGGMSSNSICTGPANSVFQPQQQPA
jgi:NADPH:quinone reductase-like Zn-dependent oxidoreductase